MARYQQSQQFEKGPHYDRGRSSRAFCILGLALSWLVGICSLGAGLYVLRTGGVRVTDIKYIAKHPFTIPGGIATNFNKYVRQIAPLGLDILVTGFTDGLGYIHAVSLRWALQKESRLTFNSNLRLFTSAKRSKANAWYTNFMMVVFLVMSYASTSLIFVGEHHINQRIMPAGKNTFVCAYAMITLAIAILGQATVASICLLSVVKAPTWSSDPWDTTAACISIGGLQPRYGRCMRSVHDLGKPAVPVSPSLGQESALAAHKEVRHVTRFTKISVVLALLWGIVLILLISTLRGDGLVNGHNWSFFPELNPEDSQAQTAFVAIRWTGNTYQAFDFNSFCWAFILIGVIQALLTLSLHCAELIVNTIRDEKSWREASTGGHARSSNAVSSALSSLPALVLFIMKPIIHWLYSLAVAVYFSEGVNMTPPQVFYLAGGAAVLAIFTSVCANWKPKGPQPAAFGHLQTLADLIDTWPKEGEKIYWGQKDQEHQVPRNGSDAWHAGTAAKPLTPVSVDRKYQGEVEPEIYDYPT